LSAVKELGAQRGQMIKDLMAILNRGCYKFWHNRLLSKCIGRKNVS
jgi:SAM-dependent MidA family methyltransferase